MNLHQEISPLGRVGHRCLEFGYQGFQPTQPFRALFIQLLQFGNKTGSLTGLSPARPEKMGQGQVARPFIGAG
jgi:hypothetical protein